MIQNTKVEITLRDNEKGTYLQIPVLPEKINYKDGQKKSLSVDIVNLGTVRFPSGVELDAISWASFFPARYDEAYVQTPQLKAPVDYRNQLSTWKDNGTSLQLVCPAAGLNKTVFLESFDWDFGGWEGDIVYQVTFSEYKTVKPQQITMGKPTVPPKGKKPPNSRPPAPAKPKPSTYTVVAGDSLSKIAKKLDVADWHDIYTRNRATIGPNPAKIKPGQVLKV